MKKNIIFVFAVLLMLAVVNPIPYKRSTTFGPCPGDNPPPTLDVSISPDPPQAGQDVTFTITGSMATVDGDKVGIVFTDLSGTPLAPPFKKAVPPASSVNLVETVTAPANLPDQYAIGVGIGDLDVSPPVLKGCAVGVIGLGGIAASPF